jgi:GT2 family glycosyltransferase
MNDRTVLPARLSVVILTHNRVPELLHTLARLQALPERPPLIVVDNASDDDTAALVRARFPEVQLIRLERNLGAAARNAGVQRAATPYVAFCDDDTWWAPGALTQAADLLDAHPRIAVLNARILIGDDLREDPTCARMARSPLPAGPLPGPALIGFMAGAAVFRRSAYLEAGGYEPALFLGGEETLLGIDLAARGWAMVYAPQLLLHHHPSPRRDSRRRHRLLARNAIWIAWLRLRWPTALRQTLRALRLAHRWRVLPATLADTLRGLPWALRHRRVTTRDVESMYRKVHP